jgi:hypothetical protein
MPYAQSSKVILNYIFNNFVQKCYVFCNFSTCSFMSVVNMLCILVHFWILNFQIMGVKVCCTNDQESQRAV